MGSESFTPNVLLYLSTADGLPRLSNCSYQAVLNHLELTRENELYSMTRPVQDHNRTTWVNLEVVLYAILDVVSCSSFCLQMTFVIYKLSFKYKTILSFIFFFLETGRKRPEIQPLCVDGHGEI